LFFKADSSSSESSANEDEEEEEDLDTQESEEEEEEEEDDYEEKEIIHKPKKKIKRKYVRKTEIGPIGDFLFIIILVKIFKFNLNHFYI
jgi:hypothetical protein